MQSIVLIISIFLISCGQDVPKNIPPFPAIKYIYEMDSANMVCAQYEVISYTPFTISEYPIATEPIASCDGMVTITMRDFQSFIEYKRKVERELKKVKIKVN